MTFGEALWALTVPPAAFLLIFCLPFVNFVTIGAYYLATGRNGKESRTEFSDGAAEPFGGTSRINDDPDQGRPVSVGGPGSSGPSSAATSSNKVWPGAAAGEGGSQEEPPRAAAAAAPTGRGRQGMGGQRSSGIDSASGARQPVEGTTLQHQPPRDGTKQLVMEEAAIVGGILGSSSSSSNSQPLRAAAWAAAAPLEERAPKLMAGMERKR